MAETGDPTLDQLRVLAAIADAGSFSGAARKLHRAQSVISYTVANLETQLGVALFDRTGRTTVPTEAGRALTADARRIGLLVDELRGRATALRRGTEAEVALAVDVMFPIPRLTCLLREFSDAFPTVGLRLRMEAVGGVTQSVLEGACVLGVSGWAGNLPHALRHRVVGTLRLIPVAAPFHPLASLATVDAAAVRQYTQLVLTDASRLTEGQDYGVLSLRTWRLGDLGAKHALLIAGLGWGNMPEHLVTDDIAAGRLKRLAVEEGPSFEYTISLVQRVDAALGPASRWIAERFENKAKEGRGSALDPLGP
jgi:DNA-binding transcriptional LysR family regulator